MSFEHLSVASPAEGILQVTLNRPRQFNALAKKTFVELDHVLNEFEQGADRVLILTGAGRAFCFGADFQEFKDQAALPGLLALFQALILRIHHCAKVTIAALNGFATGAGLDLALSCDFRIASERAKLGEAYVSMGLVSDGGGTYFLPRIVGTSRAMQMLITGESLDAAEARSLGLVNWTCTAEELSARSLEIAVSIAAKPQTAVRLLKKLVLQNAGANLQSALANERDAQLECFSDPQHRELVQQFLAKRG